MRQSDHAVRLAAFGFLDEHVRLSGEEEAIRRSVLERGFVLDGERVPTMTPSALTGCCGIGRYRGTDPSHHQNRGLRLAMPLQVPLVYFHGIVPGLYAAE